MPGVGFSLRQYRAGGDYVSTRDQEMFGRQFKAGEVIPYRELGVHEVRMHELWRCNLVDCAPLAPLPAAKPAKASRAAR